MSTLRRRPRPVVWLLLLAVAVLALGRVPVLEPWTAVCALVSIGLVAAALVLAVREMVVRRPSSRSGR